MYSKLLFTFLFFFLNDLITCELIQHSYQSDTLEHGLDVTHSNHKQHLAQSPHLTDGSEVEHSDKHGKLEFIEVPDSVSEIALKAVNFNEAQNFAKKFGFKNLGRVPNLPDTYYFVRDEITNRKRNLDPLSEHQHKEPKPVYLNDQHKIYFLEDQVPLKRYKRDLMPGPTNNYSKQRRASDRRSNYLRGPSEQKVVTAAQPLQQTFANLPQQKQQATFSPRQFFIPFSFFNTQRPEIEFNKPVIFSNEAHKMVQHQPQSVLPMQQVQQIPMNYDDELFSKQWYLNQDGTYNSKPALHVRDAWNMGVTGKGVVVTVIDDGLEWNHTDLVRNYDPEASIDINGRDNDPTPNYFDDNAHGTRCAGEIAMVAGNRKCGVGIAYNARIGGIRLLDGNVKDIFEAQAFLHNFHHIQIYSSSWGPSDDGETVDGPKPLAREALQRGTQHGRRGLGSIYVWASGNGGKKGDNCNCDGYVGSIYTLAIGSVGQNGHFPWYGERCSAMHAVTYSSDTSSEQKITTTDLRNRCTSEHSGTSAAAPIAAGILALTLEMNPNLTWRDIQHLVTWSSDFAPMKDSPGWRQNAVGLLYNDRFGFGMLNAARLADKARYWRTVPPLRSCKINSDISFKRKKFVDGFSPTLIVLESSACRGTVNEVNYVEQVQARISLQLPERGSVEIFLISPSGTGSVLLTKRKNDASSSGFYRWNFTSVHFWGEPAYGNWKLFFKLPRGAYGGEVTYAKLYIHGTAEKPSHMYDQPRRVYPEFTGDINKVLDFTMPFDNELKNVQTPELDFHHIIDWSSMIHQTNQLHGQSGGDHVSSNVNFDMPRFRSSL